MYYIVVLRRLHDTQSHEHSGEFLCQAACFIRETLLRSSGRSCKDS
jgi:hypothetical protein